MYVVKETIPVEDIGDDDDGCCRDCCREECRCCYSFGLDHHNPRLFSISQWRGPLPRLVYVVYRVIVMLYFAVWLVLSGTGIRADPTYFIFLTNWSFLLLNLRLIVQAVVAWVYWHYYDWKKNEGPKYMGFLLRFEWFLFNTSMPAGILTSFNYWVLLYLPDPNAYDPDIVSIHTHGINSLIILLDLFIVAIPLRVLHFYQSFLFLLTYFVFNAIYILAGGLNDNGQPFIYPGMEWNTDPGAATIVVAISLATGIAAWLVVYALHWLRRGLALCCPWCGDVTTRRRREHTVYSQEVDVWTSTSNVYPATVVSTKM